MTRYTRNRRKKFLIDRNFQVYFIVKFCLLILIAAVVSGVLIYFFTRQGTTVLFDNREVVVKSTSEYILPVMLEILVFVAVIVSFAAILITLFASHKIAGPLYRVTEELKRIKTGNLSSAIRLRTDDQLQKLVSELDGTRLFLKGSLRMITESWEAIREHVRKSKDALEDEEERKEMEEHVRRIDEELSKYSLD